MTTENICPYCGSPLESTTGSQCPSCGSALPSRPASVSAMTPPKPEFTSSAEAMDEVKKLIREGDTEAAAQIASAEFGLSQDAAQDTIEQVEIDMQHSGSETPLAEPEPAPTFTPVQPEVISAPLYGSPQKPSNARKWIIGGVIAAVIFLCVCCILPILLLVPIMRSG